MSAQLVFPSARSSDPDTSREAATCAKPANADLVDYIRRALGRCGPLSQEQIAVEVLRAQPGRWRESTVVTACARASLREFGRTKNSRGRWVWTWTTS